jgi:hypothetical protein
MAHQVTKKLDDLWTLDRLIVQLKVEIIKGDARNHAQRFPVEVVLQDRGLPARGPSAHFVRPGAESAFVDQNDLAAFFLGFFLSAGQVTFFHSAMAASLRSSARPTGRWQLQPSCRSNFQTCAGW